MLNDQIHLYAKNLEQDKYRNMMKKMNRVLVKMLVMMF